MKEIKKNRTNKKGSVKKNNIGRPPIFQTPEELQTAIEAYFNECRNNKTKVLTKDGKVVDLPDPKIPTIAGCAYAVGMDRHTFYDYENKDEFSHTIKRARNYIIAQWESKCINTNANAGGIIFIAKNYGYTDKQEFEHSGGVKILRDTIPRKLKEKSNATGN